MVESLPLSFELPSSLAVCVLTNLIRLPLVFFSVLPPSLSIVFLILLWEDGVGPSSVLSLLDDLVLTEALCFTVESLLCITVILIGGGVGGSGSALLFFLALLSLV